MRERTLSQGKRGYQIASIHRERRIDGRREHYSKSARTAIKEEEKVKEVQGCPSLGLFDLLKNQRTRKGIQRNVHEGDP